jgi:dihydrofolate reductase
MNVSLIAALSTNNVIGRDTQVPWRLSTDLKRFKALTMGHHLIMGRKTYDSVGTPLPGRITVVITRQQDYAPEGVVVVHSLDEAVEFAEKAGETIAYIAGGGEIFEQSLHRVHRMDLTRVHADVEGDAYFPEFDDVTEWQLTDSEHYEADAKNEFPYSFLTYERVAGQGHPIPADE